MKKGILYLTAAALLWSFSGLASKAVSWNGFCIYVVRGMVSCVLMMVFCRRLPGKIWGINLPLAFCFAMQSVFFVVANKYTTAANAAVLQNTSPFYIILYTAIAARAFPKRKDLLVCLTLFAGVLLSCMGNGDAGGMFGNFMALLSALFYAAVFVGGKIPGADTVDFMILGNGLSFLMFPAVLARSEIRTSGMWEWFGVILFGVIVTIAWLLFAKGLRTTSSLQANFIAMLEPVMAPVWTFLFLGEKISLFSLIGFFVVIEALVYYHLPGKGNGEGEKEAS